jgi:hypothetical protein
MIEFPKKGDRFLWMGTYCFVRRSSPEKKWADLLIVMTTGDSWIKRQKVTDKMLNEALVVDRDDFPSPGTGLTPRQDRELALAAAKVGYQRECALGNHGGCSDPAGQICQCTCHEEVTVNL